MMLINSRYMIKFVANTFLYSFIIFVSSFLSSCKKLVEVAPPTNVISQANVYENDATASAVLTGLYINMSTNNIGQGGLTNIPLITGLSSDELSLFAGVQNQIQIQYYSNSLNPSQLDGSEPWNTIYPIIFVANSALEGLAASTGLTPSVKKQLIGEAKFMRAFCYFYLTNLYGDIPLATKTDYKANASLERTAQDIVYTQIEADLKDAQTLLSDVYLKSTLLSPSTERIRPTKWAATALLARMYLYIGRWSEAADQSSSVISNTSLFDIVPLTDVFLKNNMEAVWQLQPVNVGWNTEDAKTFIVPASGLSEFVNPVFMGRSLLSSFENGDLRRVAWVDSVIVENDTIYFPNKYRSATQDDPVTEYNTVFRLSEQYLIRAEAKYRLNDYAGSLSDLNVIRNRAGLQQLTDNSDASIFKAIIHDRQIEFFTEWGHRWLDLKRLNVADEILSVIKGSNWQRQDELYPIPQTEIDKNPSLKGHQNPGYN
jgi:starch-binding outer membrane protein, SusD/RagB family